jgi:hypothetical protein
LDAQVQLVDRLPFAIELTARGSALPEVVLFEFAPVKIDGKEAGLVPAPVPFWTVTLNFVPVP